MTRERRAFLLGFKRGVARARTELDKAVKEAAERWEDRLYELEDGYAAPVAKLRREQDIKQAVLERAADPTAWLN